MTEVSKEIARQSGFKITHHQLNFFGLCPQCQKEGQSVGTKEKEMAKDKKTLTTAFGIPVADDQNSLTAGEPRAGSNARRLSFGETGAL